MVRTKSDRTGLGTSSLIRASCKTLWLHKKQTTKYTKHTKNQREIGDFILVYLVYLVVLQLHHYLESSLNSTSGSVSTPKTKDGKWAMEMRIHVGTNLNFQIIKGE